MADDDDARPTIEDRQTAYATVGLLLQLGLMELLVSKGLINEAEINTLYREAGPRLFDAALNDKADRMANNLLDRLIQRPFGKPGDDVRRLFRVI